MLPWSRKHVGGGQAAGMQTESIYPASKWSISFWQEKHWVCPSLAAFCFALFPQSWVFHPPCKSLSGLSESSWGQPEQFPDHQKYRFRALAATPTDDHSPSPASMPCSGLIYVQLHRRKRSCPHHPQSTEEAPIIKDRLTRKTQIHGFTWGLGFLWSL